MKWAKKQALAPWPSWWTWENCTVITWILWAPSTRSTSKKNIPKKLLLPSHPIPTHSGRACGERVTFPHPAIGLQTPLPPCPFISQISLLFHTGLHCPCLSLVSRYWYSASQDTVSWPPQKQSSSNKNKLTNQSQTNKQKPTKGTKSKQTKGKNLNFEVLQEVKAVSAVLCCTYWCRWFLAAMLLPSQISHLPRSRELVIGFLWASC